MPRIHGYTRKGERCYGINDWHSKGRTNAIGAIVEFVFLTIGLFQGSVNSDVFYAWLTQSLIPMLPANAVVVMDNASFHKRVDMIEAIEKSGALLEF